MTLDYLYVAYLVFIALLTGGVLLYLRHLVRVSGTDPVDDPALAEEFRASAPYHLLKNVLRDEVKEIG